MLTVIVVLLTLNIIIFPIVIPRYYVAEAATIKLNKSKVSIKVGESYQLKLNGTKDKIKWSSSKKSIVKVSSEGIITGVKPGSAIITAKVNNKEYKCNVTVLSPILKKSIYEVSIGDTIQLEVKNFPLNINKKDIQYRSNDENIVVVDNNGLVTAKTEGYTNVIIYFGTYELTCNIRVRFTDKNREDIINNIQYECVEVGNEIIYVVKNNSNVGFITKLRLEFYDNTDKLVSISFDNYLSLFSGDESVLYFTKPDKDYSYYKPVIDIINGYNFEINQKDKIEVRVSDKYEYTYQYRDIPYPNKMTDTIQLFDVTFDNQSGKRIIFNLNYSS